MCSVIILKMFSFFQKVLCDAGLVRASGEAGTLDEPGLLHVTGSVGSSSLDELHILLQLERYHVVHDALDEVNGLGVGPGQGGELAVEKSESNNLARQRRVFIVPADLGDTELTTYQLQYHFIALMKTSQDEEAVTPVCDSDMAVTVQHFLPFLITTQKMLEVELLDNRLYSSDRDKARALIDAVLAERSLQLSNMCCVNVTRRV